MEYLGMNSYYNPQPGDLGPPGTFVRETRMVTADARVLLYLSECALPVSEKLEAFAGHRRERSPHEWT